MKANYYTIRAITNMHVGSGDNNYGVIDNLVQRDVVTELPTINGSSLKGAVKEFFENEWKNDKTKIAEVFGDENNASNYRFLPASLLALPVRSNKKPYFLATAPMVINSLVEQFQYLGNTTDLSVLQSFSPRKGVPIIFTSRTGLFIEDFYQEDFEVVAKPENDFPIFGTPESLVIFNDEDFKNLCGETGLPVIARNKVGENNNLWYEQIVPRESIFGFGILLSSEANYLSDFNDALTAENSLVHIGANATVGQGFTKIAKL